MARLFTLGGLFSHLLMKRVPENLHARVVSTARIYQAKHKFLGTEVASV